jgi:exopolysaccharide production protein ExoZ
MLLELQLLRGAAAYLVVLVHLCDLFPKTSVTNLLRDKGYSGVDLFFVISGFIMVYTTSQRPITAIQFLLDRLKRITPLYYATTLFVFCIALAFPSVVNSTSPDAWALLKSLAFIPFEKSAGRIYPIYYLGWTLNYEMFFYLVFAISLLICHDMRVYICSAAICLLVLLGFVAASASENLVLYFYTRPIMLDFVLGMLTAAFRDRIMKTVSRAKPIPWLILAVGTAGLFGASYVFPNSPSAFAPPTSTFLIFGLPSSLIVMGAVLLEGVETNKAWRPFIRIGDASYSIYLSHFFVVAAMIGFADYMHLPPGLRAALGVVALFLIAVVGICLYQFFERPMRSVLAKRLTAGGGYEFQWPTVGVPKKDQGSKARSEVIVSSTRLAPRVHQICREASGDVGTATNAEPPIDSR